MKRLLIFAALAGIIIAPLASESLTLGPPVLPIGEDIEGVEVRPFDDSLEVVADLDGFRPLSGLALPEDGEEGVFWLRFSVTNPADRAVGYHLTLRKGGFWRADVSYIDDIGFVERVFAYNALRDGFGANAIAPYVAFPVTIEAGGTKTVYVRLKAYYIDRLAPMLVRDDILQGRLFLFSVLFGTVYGVLVGLLFYNFTVLWGVSRRDVLFYLPFHLLTLCYLAGANGVLVSLFPSFDFFYLRFNLLPSLSAAALGCMLLFVRRFYSLRSAGRFIDAGIAVTAWVLFAFPALLLSTIELFGNIVSVATPILLGTTLTLVGTAWIIRRRELPTEFPLAWLCFFSGAILSYLSDLGMRLHGAQYLSLNGEQIGITLFLVFVSTGIAGRLRSIRGERERMRLAEAQARSRLREVVEIAKAKAEFVADVSHDLRTPLANISLAAEELLDDGGSSSSDAKRIAATVIDQTNVLVRRVEELLTFSHHESAVGEFTLEAMNLNALVGGIVAKFDLRARRSKIDLRCENRSALPLIVTMNEEMLDSIVSNLIENALRYTPPGGTIEVLLDSADRTAVLEVSETGAGIDEAHLPLIFDRSFGDGTGIGLSLVRAFTERLGGSVSVSSVVGKGSRFTLRFPTVAPTGVSVAGSPDETAREVEPGDLASARARTPGGDTVMIVEDDPQLLVHLKAIIAPDFRVEEFTRAEEALAAILKAPPGLLICDVMLPGMSGLELLRRLRDRPALNDLPVIVVTARSDEKTEREALQLGVIDVIRKPFSRRALSAKVRNVLAYRSSVYRSVENGIKRQIDEWRSATPDGDPGGEVRNVPTAEKRSDRAVDWKREFGLTDRQERVLALVVKGYTNQEIARVLGLSPRTVENHVSRLLAKFDVDRRTQLTFDVLEGIAGKS